MLIIIGLFQLHPKDKTICQADGGEKLGWPKPNKFYLMTNFEVSRSIFTPKQNEAITFRSFSHPRTSNDSTVVSTLPIRTLT